MATQQLPNTTPGQFNLNEDGYLAFNGWTITDVINDRLNQSGVFTDQNFQGSNLTAVHQTFAYVFSMLMMYLNQTSSESMFTESQLYENINRIVKELGYNPIGYQSSTLSFSATSKNLTAGTYTIPRYSYIDVAGIPFSFSEDITFGVTDQGEQSLDRISSEKQLYQGRWVEHPQLAAVGAENERIVLSVNDDSIIDHFNIDVYVKKREQQTWSHWKPTQSLYLHTANEYRYEIRLDENKQYQLMFGNNINGAKLTNGDLVAIYYLKSSGDIGTVGIGALANQRLSRFDTVNLREIIEDTKPVEYNQLTNQQMANSLAFDNASSSTAATEQETADQIRQNAPGVFRTQYRVVTAGDYVTFILTNFANIIHDVQVLNNDQYINQVLKYYHDIGLNNPAMADGPLYSQLTYSDACNFNNVYIVGVPKTINLVTGQPNDIPEAARRGIIDTLQDRKVATSETVMLEPVKIAYDFATPISATPTDIDRAQSTLVLVQSSMSRTDPGSIKQQAIQLMTDYFLPDGKPLTLGFNINITALNAALLAIDGVSSIYTVNQVSQGAIQGVSLVSWNPVYPSADRRQVTQSAQLQPFMLPYWYQPSQLSSRIDVRANSDGLEVIET